jgi:hypothetical protein
MALLKLTYLYEAITPPGAGFAKLASSIVPALIRPRGKPRFSTLVRFQFREPTRPAPVVRSGRSEFLGKLTRLAESLHRVGRVVCTDITTERSDRRRL